MIVLPPAEKWTHPDEVAAYALACLQQLRLEGWTFHWDHATRRLGCCWPTRQRISLSRYYASSSLPEQAGQLHRTLLHELAHALAWHHQRATGHGEAWKSWCRELGIAGERSTTRVADFTPPHLQHKPRYVLCHDETGEIFRHYRRKPQLDLRRLRRSFIPGRREETLGHLVLCEVLLRENEGVPS